MTANDTMTRIEHVNCGWLHKPPLPPASCHCLMVLSGNSAVLIDTGIGMHDIVAPEQRIGSAAVDAAGFKFLPEVTAIRQLESRGMSASSVTDIVLTHCDSDHVGGLSDFPNARVHLASEEKVNLDAGNPRYTPRQFSHGPNWRTYSENNCEVLGLPSRRINTTFDLDIRLVPLFGHTNGHCGVAIHHNGAWIIHVGDAYYLRDELTNEDHPISGLATLRADNNKLRKESLEKLRQLTRRTDVDLTYFGYHDISELPDTITMYEDLA
ncbi:MAG: MBL fold metallo-hydrolase [Planctomycetaceae bacterium]|nr:MBL fold metallo-hydrolase [Planctomycetaceae bacterium]